MSNVGVKWILKNEKGQLRGPYTTEQILNYIRDGLFVGTEMIAKYPDGAWTILSKEPDFYDQILESLESQINPALKATKNETPVIEETIFMPLPEGAERKKNSDEQKVQEIINLAEPKKTNINSFQTPQVVVPKAVSENQMQNKAHEKLSHQSPPKSEPSVIQLQKLGPVKKIEVLKKSKMLVVLFLILVGALGYLIISDSDKPTDRISLIIPQKGKAALSEQEVKQRLASAIRALEKDTVENYIEAQNKVVSIVEGAPSNLEVRGLLCYVYKELWPYTKQDSQDLKAISQISQTTRVLNIMSPFGNYCEAVKLFATGRYKEAKGTVESILESNETFSLLPIVYQFKAEMLEADKDMISAIPYYEKAAEFWPEWMKPKISLGFAYVKNNEAPKSAVAFKLVLQKNPKHRLAKIGLGIIEYKLFKQPETAQTLLTSALGMKGRIPKAIEAEGLFSLAMILVDKGEKGQALSYAEKAYQISPSSEVIKQLVLRLGGSDKVKDHQGQSELLYIGDQYARSGDCLSAQAEYKAAFEADPQNGTAAMKAAKCLWQLNQSYEATEWLKKSIKAEPKLISSYVLLADYLSQRFDFLSAAQVLANANRVSQNNSEILKGMALLEYRKNNMVGAINYAQRSIKLYDADIDTLIVLSRANRLYALSLVNGKDAEKRDAAAISATRYATKAVELDSTYPEAQIAFAEITAATSGVDLGINYLKELIKKYSFSYEYRVALGDLMRSEERFNQAREIYEQIILADPKNKKALLGLGLSYKALTMPDKALKSFLNAALVDPTDAEPLYLAGQVYQEMNRYEEALNQFKRVLKVNPNYPRTHYNIGRTAFSIGDLETAINEVKEEKKMNPNVADSYILAAEILLAKKQFSDCAAEYSMALKLRPMGAEIYVKAAQCYRLSGSLEIADDMLSLAQQRESGYAEIYREQGSLFHMRGDTAAALRSFQKYLELSPNAPDRHEVEAMISKLGG